MRETDPKASEGRGTGSLRWEGLWRWSEWFRGSRNLHITTIVDIKRKKKKHLFPLWVYFLRLFPQRGIPRLKLKFWFHDTKMLQSHQFSVNVLGLNYLYIICTTVLAEGHSFFYSTISFWAYSKCHIRLWEHQTKISNSYLHTF